MHHKSGILQLQCCKHMSNAFQVLLYYILLFNNEIHHPNTCLVLDFSLANHEAISVPALCTYSGIHEVTTSMWEKSCKDMGLTQFIITWSSHTLHATVWQQRKIEKHVYMHPQMLSLQHDYSIKKVEYHLRPIHQFGYLSPSARLLIH